MKFENALNIILDHEGGYSDDPDDPGGATNFGITHKTLSEYRGRTATPNDVKRLRREEAQDIYRRYYWDVCQCEILKSGVDLMIFDSAVNQGPGRAIRFLQESIHVHPDGIIGPITMSAAGNYSAQRMVDEIAARRGVHYARLNPKFHLGWYRRLMGVHRRAVLCATEVDNMP